MRYPVVITALEPGTIDLRAKARLELAAAFQEIDTRYPDPAVQNIRSSAPAEDDDGNPLWPDQPPKQRGGVRFPLQKSGKRPSCAEVELRVATIQLWIAERQPYVVIKQRAKAEWTITSRCTLDKYIRLARARMVDELIDNRLIHQAEQIYALMECARRAAEAEQFSAAVGAHRVIAEIAGMLRAPSKPHAERP